ncbi:hypothetical protein BRD13_08660 [Halobacteriales archaeon SW_5_70_135]|nr:MAG: hypothetical protein BRD13_08660 [Halobacteriales archaeon SW_5_70_135]
MELCRRRLLRVGATGAAAAVAGCGSDRSRPGESTSATPDGTTATTSEAVPLGTTRTVDAREVALTGATVRDSVFTRPFPDTVGVDGAEGGRYVFVRVETPAGTGPPSERFALVADRDRFRGEVDSSWSDATLDFGAPYDPDDGTAGHLAFRVPAPLDAGRLRVTVGGTPWRLPDKVGERLARPSPAYELASADVPDRVAAGEAFDLAATFENVADVAGDLRCAFVVSGAGFPCCPSRPRTEAIGPGENGTVRATFGDGDETVPESGEVDARLRWPDGLREYGVVVDAA